MLAERTTLASRGYAVGRKLETRREKDIFAPSFSGPFWASQVISRSLSDVRLLAIAGGLVKQPG